MAGKHSVLGLGIALGLLGGCGKDIEEPCNPLFENECDVLQDYVCVSCAGKGWSASQGYCYMADYAEPVWEHVCRDAWGEPGASDGGGTASCSGDASGCRSAWTGSANDQAMYNCQAACAEKAVCNDAGVKANCDILRGYGSDTVGRCTTCR